MRRIIARNIRNGSRALGETLFTLCFMGKAYNILYYRRCVYGVYVLSRSAAKECWVAGFGIFGIRSWFHMVDDILVVVYENIRFLCIFRMFWRTTYICWMKFHYIIMYKYDWQNKVFWIYIYVYFLYRNRASFSTFHRSGKYGWVLYFFSGPMGFCFIFSYK